MVSEDNKWKGMCGVWEGLSLSSQEGFVKDNFGVMEGLTVTFCFMHVLPFSLLACLFLPLSV